MLEHAAMLDATAQGKAETGAPTRGVDGRLVLGVARKGDGVGLADLYQRQPLRFLFPRHGADDPMTAVVANTGGGLVGGDRLATEIAVGTGASLLVTGQAAEKVYRSAGADSRVRARYTVADGAWLEVLPQGTILFDGVRLDRRSDVRLEGNARAMLGEILVFGRGAMGEALLRGRLHEEWRVSCSGRLVWADALHLDRDIPGIMARAAGFHGARALATFLYAGPDAADRLAAARALVDDSGEGLRVGATVLDRVLLVRWLGADPAAVRRAYGAFWAFFRARVGGWPQRLPTIWAI